eukprot:712261-Amorphochlora_amoeboformis.AAC.1
MKEGKGEKAPEGVQERESAKERRERERERDAQHKSIRRSLHRQRWMSRRRAGVRGGCECSKVFVSDGRYVCHSARLQWKERSRDVM